MSVQSRSITKLMLVPVLVAAALSTASDPAAAAIATETGSAAERGWCKALVDFADKYGDTDSQAALRKQFDSMSTEKKKQFTFQMLSGAYSVPSDSPKAVKRASARMITLLNQTIQRSAFDAWDEKWTELLGSPRVLADWNRVEQHQYEVNAEVCIPSGLTVQGPTR